MDTPPPNGFRIHRPPGKTLWQLQGLTADESITLEILKQGVSNSKGSLSRSYTHWNKRFEIADKQQIVSVIDLDVLIKNEAIASRDYMEALKDIENNFKTYRGLLDVWLKPPHAQGEQQPPPIIDFALYGALQAEINKQISTVINKNEEVTNNLLKILDRCRKKVENGGLALATGSRTLSSSSNPSQAPSTRKWGPVKELKFTDKLVEGSTINDFTVWRRRMNDYLALPEITSYIYPSTKDQTRTKFWTPCEIF